MRKLFAVVAFAVSVMGIVAGYQPAYAAVVAPHAVVAPQVVHPNCNARVSIDTHGAALAGLAQPITFSWGCSNPVHGWLSIHYGDGGYTQAEAWWNSGSVTEHYTYAQGGYYTISVTLYDDGNNTLATASTYMYVID